YRGPLSSCNYACAYCPFAKRHEGAAELAADRQALERFVGWGAGHPAHQLGGLFTPWGEGLIRPHHQGALVRPRSPDHGRGPAIQGNWWWRVEWVGDCDRERLALWTTFHPTEVSRARFLARCRELDRRGVRYSVGVVGLKEHAEEIEALRRELPPHVYLWVN